MEKGIERIAKLTERLSEEKGLLVAGFYNYEDKEFYGDIVHAHPLESEVRYPYELAFTLHAKMSAETLKEYIDEEVILPKVGTEE